MKSATLYLSLWTLWPINRDKPYLRASEGWGNCSIFYLLAVCLHFQKLVIGKILGVLTMTVFEKSLNFGFTEFQEYLFLSTSTISKNSQKLIHFNGYFTIATPVLAWPDFSSKFTHSSNVTIAARFLMTRVHLDFFWFTFKKSWYKNSSLVNRHFKL